MKCEYCAGNLSIEDRRCPHCDAENPFYKAHRADMDAYNKRFNKTEQDVVEKTNRFTKRTLNITVISILVALITIAIVVLINIDEINYRRYYNKNTRNAAMFARQLQGFEDNGDYMKIGIFYYSIDLRTYNNEMAEFNYLGSTASSYKALSESFARVYLQNDKYFHEDAESLAKSITRNLEVMYRDRYDYCERESYKGKNLELHKKSMDQIIEDTHVLLRAYLGLTKEETDSLKDMTSSERQYFLEGKAREVLNEE